MSQSSNTQNLYPICPMCISTAGEAKAISNCTSCNITTQNGNKCTKCATKLNSCMCCGEGFKNSREYIAYFAEITINRNKCINSYTFMNEKDKRDLIKENNEQFDRFKKLFDQDMGPDKIAELSYKFLFMDIK
jgi:hypothetical protein